MHLKKKTYYSAFPWTNSCGRRLDIIRWNLWHLQIFVFYSEVFFTLKPVRDVTGEKIPFITGFLTYKGVNTLMEFNFETGILSVLRIISVLP